MKNISKQIVSGSVAGAVGAFAMRQAVLLWSSVVNGDPKRTVFGLDEEADLNSVQMLSNAMFHKTVPEATARKIALALHYGYGVAAGAAYAVLAAKNSKVAAGFGTAYGTIIFVFGDELAIGASGASNPFTKKAASHISALAAHLLFGAAVELTRRTVIKLLPPEQTL